jgi:hypothetical protein
MESQAGRREITLLIDHNMTGYARLLWTSLVGSGWLELIAVRMVTLEAVGLSIRSDDRTIWRFAQRNHMILLTDNRRQSDIDSLGETIEQENTPTSLPVLTVGNRQRLQSRPYREACISRLVEIVIDLDNHRGIG